MTKKIINNFKENNNRKQSSMKNKQLIFNNKNKTLTINNMKEKTIRESNNKKQSVIKNKKRFHSLKKGNHFNNKVINQELIRNKNKILRRHSRLTARQKKIFREKCKETVIGLEFKSDFYKSWFQSQRLLKTNKTQLINHIVKWKPRYRLKENFQVEKNLPRKFLSKDAKNKYLRTKRIDKFFKKRWRFLRIKKLDKNFNFFSEFWIKYKSICQTNDYLNIRRHYHKIKLLKKRRRLNYTKYSPSFFFSGLLWYQKLKFFTLPKLKYKKNPWLNPLYHTRKLYRLTRSRTYRRYKERLPHLLHRVFFYNKFLKLMHPPSKIIRGRGIFHLYGILRRYIISPYLNKMKPKQLRALVKKLKKSQHVFTGNNFQANFENRLDILAYKMNFAPTIHLSRILISLGFIWVSKLSDQESMRLSSIKLRDVIVIESNKNNRNIKFVKQIAETKAKFLVELKNKWNEIDIIENNLESYKNEELINQEACIDPSYILKKDEIIHISPYLTKLLSKNFMNKLRKKRISYHIFENQSKSAGLLNQHFKRGCTVTFDRLKPQYWNPTYLAKTR
jgi:hypothetical protein